MKANTQGNIKVCVENIGFTKKKMALLTLVLWLHITVLNLFVVTAKGPQILWQDNIKLETLLTHALLVAASVLTFVGINYAYSIKNNKSLSNKL